MDAGLAQTSTAERDQERVAAGLHETLVAQPRIVGEGVHRAVVQHDLSALAELAVEDPQQLVAIIDVGTIETDRLAQSHPGDRQQTDQRLVVGGQQRWLQPSGGVQQRRDLRRLIEVGDRSR
jgi:hypothetical protein